MNWRRDISTPARIYQSDDDRFEIVWDPDGWHLWEGRELLGVFVTLYAAKEAAAARQDPDAEASDG